MTNTSHEDDRQVDVSDTALEFCKKLAAAERVIYTDEGTLVFKDGAWELI